MKPGIVHLMRGVHRVCRSRVGCPSAPCARWPMGQVHRTGAGARVLVCTRPDCWREVSAAGLRVVAGRPDNGRGTPTPSALLVVTAPRSGAESDRPLNGRTTFWLPRKGLRTITPRTDRRAGGNRRRRDGPEDRAGRPPHPQVDKDLHEAKQALTQAINHALSYQTNRIVEAPDADLYVRLSDVERNFERFIQGQTQ